MPTPSGSVKSSLGDHRLAAIVSTDVSGFSALVEMNPHLDSIDNRNRFAENLA